jgi:hypothetical protein
VPHRGARNPHPPTNFPKAIAPLIRKHGKKTFEKEHSRKTAVVGAPSLDVF